MGIMKKLLLGLLVLASFGYAAQIVVIEPVPGALSQGQVLDLGVVGPGQKIEIVAERLTGEMGRGGGEALWDRFVAVAESLPQGWTSEPSKFYESPMRAYVTVARDAADGDYVFTLKTIDEYEGVLGTTIQCTVSVSRNVLETGLLEERVSAGAEQPAVYYLRLKNKSSASDVFEISVAGLPKENAVVKRIFVRHNSETVAPYEVYSGEQGEYSLTFNVVSLSSDAINGRPKGTLITYSSLYYDMLACSRGILLFPSVEQTLYAIFGIAANLK
ncbi:hypothetical protein COU36_05155 [Candidatus Micrarchaeota archaeon CG10_big_fil_rev_8_21_14_0_10_59_7]|nr:MAG: hypothetical protein COU36_05155 [Candidatus Micrarchaeota archaeon CG10_big_fil_rev_8_21_14_0_10_59_7]